MPTLNELLSTTADTDDIVFDNFQFIVDENLRTISVPALGVVFGVEGDKDVNYINFSMVRFYDGTDLSEMELHVNYINAAGDMNYYRVPNIVVQNDTIMFSWLLSHDVTKYRGTTSFTLHFFKQVNGVISKSYNTTPAHGTVLEGINAETYVPEEEQYDILTHLQAELNNYTSVKKTELAMSGQTQLNAIQQKGTATLESIPEDYTTLNNKIKNMEDHFIVTDPAEVNEVTQIEMDPSAPDQEIFTADEINRIEMTIDRDDNDEFENTFHLMYEKAHSSDEPPQIVIDDHIPNKQFVLDRVDELNEDISKVSESIAEISDDVNSLGNAVAEVTYIEKLKTVEPLDGESKEDRQNTAFTLNAEHTKIASPRISTNNKESIVCAVDGGKTYKIAYYKTADVRYGPGYAFVDDELNVLLCNEPSTGSNQAVVEDVVAPIGCTKVYVMHSSAKYDPNVDEYVRGKSYSPKSYSKNETYTKEEVDVIANKEKKGGYVVNRGKAYTELVSGKDTGLIEDAPFSMSKNGITSKKVKYLSTSTSNYYIYAEIDAPSENVGFWAYFDKNEIVEMQTARLNLTIYLQDNAHSTSNTLRYAIASTNLMVGWFFYKIPLSSFTVMGTGNANAISRVAIYVSGTYTNHPNDIVFYINGIVVDSKTKTFIMFNHDGMYANDFSNGGKIDVYKSNEINFTVFGGKKIDDVVGNNTVSELYSDLISDGICEVGQYACKYNAEINAKYGFTETKTLLQSDTYPSWEQYEELKKTRDYISDNAQGGMPVAWSAPSGIITKRNYNQLRNLGFRIARTGGYTLIGNFDADCFCVASQSIYKSDTVQSIKDVIDLAIANGCSLSLFCHQVYSGGGEHDADTSQFREIVEYVKAKQDLGLCEAVTFEEFLKQTTA